MKIYTELMYISSIHFCHCGLILAERPTPPPQRFLSTKQRLTYTQAQVCVCLISAHHVYHNTNINKYRNERQMVDVC